MADPGPSEVRPSIRWSGGAVLVAAVGIGVIEAMSDAHGSIADAARWALAGIAGAVTAGAILRLLAFAIEPATQRALLNLQYGVALAPAIWVTVLLGTPASPTPGSVRGVVLTGIAVIGVVTGIAVVVANALTRWHEATRARSTLAHALARTSRLNGLLTAAERERFAGYREVISTQVSGPLSSLQDEAAHAGDVQLANDIDRFQALVMRPLAHVLHPVSVRVGLIPAVAALGRSFSLSAGSVIAARDAQGDLLDKNVRLQVFRWIRHLIPVEGSVSLAFTIDEGHVRIFARGVRESRDLDPIQQVAGLSLRDAGSHSARLLLAPMIGSQVQVDAASPGPREPLPRLPGNRWLLLTRPPIMDVSLVLLAGLVTMPFTLAILRNAEAPELALTALLSVVIPVLLAMPLTRIRVPPGTRKGAMTAIGLWIALGIVAGLANALAVRLIAPDALTPILTTARIVGGIVRYSLIGLLILVARGYTAQAMSDAIRLRVRLNAAEADRAGVLASADETDRFLSETLHRTVQGRLSAISLLLRLGRRPEAMHEFGVLCEQTLPSLEERLLNDARLDRTWSQPLPRGDLGLDVDDRVDWQVLEARVPWIVPKFRLVIEECLINARRHGRAGAVTIDVIETEDRLTLHCEDDGRGLDAPAAKGLGSRLFDEICADHRGHWSLQRLGGRTRFVLSLQRTELASGEVSPSGFAARPPLP